MRAHRWSGHTVGERFAMKCAPPTATGCVLWTGARDRKGYGQLRVDGKAVQAHRLALRLACVDLPPGLVVNHLCWTPACVAVDHLEVVTQRENSRRQRAHQATGLRVCGHTWDDTRGARLDLCGTCSADRDRRRDRRK